jgi:ATP-dependent Clp protease ATP-binding subunit ClpC
VKGLAKKPDCVCLFDEIEKAHPKIYDVLLQLLDEGSITGSDGLKVDGSRALIIFTSNIGVKSAKELANPMGITENYEELKNKREESIMIKALKKRFSPEFLNRLDAVCYFNNLSREVLDSILQKEMNEMNKGIKNIIQKEVVLSDEVRNWILDRVELEHNGARPIIRLLEQEVEEEIANLVVNESKILNKRGSKLTAELKDDKIILK